MHSFFPNLLKYNSVFSGDQLCPTLCNPMDCSTPGFPAHYQLPELAQTHVISKVQKKIFFHYLCCLNKVKVELPQCKPMQFLKSAKEPFWV